MCITDVLPQMCYIQYLRFMVYNAFQQQMKRRIKKNKFKDINQDENNKIICYNGAVQNKSGKLTI